jgi:hypothetical protein
MHEIEKRTTPIAVATIRSMSTIAINRENAAAARPARFANTGCAVPPSASGFGKKSMETADAGEILPD